MMKGSDVVFCHILNDTFRSWLVGRSLILWTLPFSLLYNLILYFGHLHYNQWHYLKHFLKDQVYILHSHFFISKYKPAVLPVTFNINYLPYQVKVQLPFISSEREERKWDSNHRKFLCSNKMYHFQNRTNNKNRN